MEKNHMILSIAAKNAFDKIYLIPNKTLIVIEWNNLNTLRAIYQKLTANIVLHGETWK